ncbi:hypothetical protein [Flavobacterium sp. 3-210]
MVNDLKIKKYWVITLLMLFCSLNSFAQECEYSWSRNGQIYVANNTYGDSAGAFLNTPTNVTFGRYNSPVPGLNYQWNLYEANGTLVQTGSNIDFPITLTKLETYKIKLVVSDTEGCTTYEQNVTARNLSACVVPATDRYEGYLDIQMPWYGIGVNVEAELRLNNPFDYSDSKFTFNWKLYNPDGTLNKTSTEPALLVTLTEVQEYKIELEIKDLAGCSTTFTKLITPLDTCTYTSGEREGYIATDNNPDNTDLKVNIDESNNFTFYSYGNPAESFTYQWEVFNSKGISIATSDLPVFPLTLTKGGFYSLHVKVTDPVNGCETENIKEIQCLITNSCTNDNLKSQKVLELYQDLLVDLLARSIQGETDAQINASEPTAEFIALKPYITNGPKDKIYNYASIVYNFSEGSYVPGVIGAHFSFSADRDYDVIVKIGWEIGRDYDPKYITISQLKTSIREALTTDLSQYISSEEFIMSCLASPTRSASKTMERMSTNDSELNIDCDYGSHIRHIDFCPGTGATCDPSIVGYIATNDHNLTTTEETILTFHTDVPNLTYTWSILTEKGEVINMSQPDITIPYKYTFPYEGSYIIKVTAKDQTGCSSTFSLYGVVQDTHCENIPYSFLFETTTANLNYIWTAADDNGNVINTATNQTGKFTFTPVLPGYYDITLSTSGDENCQTAFSKRIFISSCGGGNEVSCTRDNALTPKVLRLFIELVTKLVSTPNGTDVNVYAQTEIAAFAPYTLGSDAKIYKFMNAPTYIYFSFTDGGQIDVTLPKSATGTITGIDLSRFYNPQGITKVTTSFSDGTSNTATGEVHNINFCPAAECIPITGVINIVKRGSTQASKKLNSSSKI